MSRMRSSVGDRVLLLLPEDPYPPMAGNALRDVQHVAILRQLGWAPAIACASARRDRHGDAGAAAPGHMPMYFGALPRLERSRLGTILRKIAYVSASLEHPFAWWLDSAMLGAFFASAIRHARPRIVIVRSTFLHLLPTLRRGFSGPIVVDCHDADEHLARVLMGTVPAARRLGPWANWRGVRRVMRRRLALADEVWAVSDIDRQRLTGLVPRARVRVVPSGMPRVPSPRPRPGDGRTVLVVGNYAYGPNSDGAIWLSRDVWPLVKKVAPQARLVLAGAGAPTALREAAAHAGAELPGAVHDLEHLYEHAAVVAVPIHIGSGTRLKVIDACRHGKAIVSTSKGVEGLPIAERVALIANHPASFAGAILALLENGGHRHIVGANALAAFEAGLSFAAVAAALGAHWRLAPERPAACA